MERKTITRWFWVWQFEKEEEWLNEMAMNGWALSGVGFCSYTFTRCEPGEYTVRLEMHKNDEAYIQFMRDSGAEFVGRVFMWIYFRKKSEYGSFDVFPDIDSRVEHLSRIARFMRIVGILNLVVGLMNVGRSAVGAVNLLCATVLMYGLGRIEGKKEQLERERLLHE